MINFFTAKIQGGNQFHPEKYFVLVNQSHKNTHNKNLHRLFLHYSQGFYNGNFPLLNTSYNTNAKPCTVFQNVTRWINIFKFY